MLKQKSKRPSREALAEKGAVVYGARSGFTYTNFQKESIFKKIVLCNL
jgi:hypothetical protein